MCTLMQKDVLIELIAATQADLSRHLDLPLNDDQHYLSCLRSEVYRTDPEQLDFDALSVKIKSVAEKYRPVANM